MKPRLISTARISLPLASALAALLAAPAAHAATLTWDNGAATGNWNTSEFNWTSPTVPWNNATPDSAVFDATGVGTVTLTEAISAGGITINTAGYTITGNTITLSGGATALTSNATSAVNSNVTISTAAGTITSSAGTLTLGGTLNAGALGLTFDGAGDTTLTGAIASGAALTKSGAGTLTLAGTNAFTSATINGGTITGSTVTLSGGATALTSSATSAVNSNVTISTAPATITSSAGTLTLGGTLNAGALGLTFTGAGNTTVSSASAMTNVASLTKSGAGTTTLSYAGTTSVAGNTTVSGGTLQLSGATTVYTSSNADWFRIGNATLQMDGGTLNRTDTTFNGLLLGESAGAISTLNQTGGTISISGPLGVMAAYNGTGAANFSGGAFTVTNPWYNGVRNSMATSISGTANVTMGTFSFGRAGESATGTRTLSLTGGTLTLTNGLAYGLGTHTATFNGGVLRAGSSSFTWAHNASVTATLTGSGMTFNTNTFNASIAQTLGGGGSLTKEGAGTLTLSSLATNYTGATTINVGTLNLSFLANASFASPILVNPGATLRFAPTGDGGIGGAATVDLRGALVYSVTGNHEQFFGGAVTANAPSTIDLTATVGGHRALFLQNGLHGSADVTVTSNSANLGLSLSGTSTYTGNLTVNGTASTVSGTGGGLAIGAGTTNLSNANLTINGTLELGTKDTGMGWAFQYFSPATTGTTLSINALNGTGVVVSNMQAASTRTLSVGNNGGTGAFSGVIANGVNNTLSFIKAGAGTQTLSGPNTYTGGTTVSAGTLLVNGSLAAASAVTVNGGTLGGSGTVGGTVTIGNSSGSADAILAPGNSIDSIDTGALSFLSDGSYAVELNGTSVTTDVTNVTGTVSINATATLAVSVAGTLSASQQYIIVSNNAADAVTGTFAGLAQDALVGTFGGTPLKISYTGGDGNDIVLYTGASGTNYASWIDGFFPGETDPLIIGAEADPDFDGIPNGVEMVVGGDPKDGMDSALLPTLELVNADPDGDTLFADYLLFTYRRSDLSVTAGVTADCETDTDLVAPWTAATGAPGVVIQVDDNFTFSPPAAAATDRVRVYVPRGSQTTLFGRLNVLVP